MLNQLSRPEAVNIKNDIHEIAKSLSIIAASIPNTETERTEKKDSVVDPFFGKIYMSKEHMDAYTSEFDAQYKQIIILMEECAELQQILSKSIRHTTYLDEECGYDRPNLIEEITHVLISIRMVCSEYSISPEEIQQEIYKKYPEGYTERTNGSK